MSLFFALLIAFGLYLLNIYIIKIINLRKINVYFEVINSSFPASKTKSKFSFFALKVWLINYFSAIYDEKLKPKGLIVVLFSALFFVVINEFFLRFNASLIIILGVLVGNFLAKKIEEKQIKKEFEENFPKALTIINGAISSGANISQALEDCAKSLESQNLAKEFKAIVKGLSIGEDMLSLFSKSYKKLPFKNYYFFLMSLLVSLKSGARLKEILSRLSKATSNAKAMQKKKEAMTSEARTSSKITAGIPFVFLVLMKFIAPQNLDYILYDQTGRLVLYYFLASEFLGMMIILFLMRKI